MYIVLKGKEGGGQETDLGGSVVEQCLISVQPNQVIVDRFDYCVFSCLCLPSLCSVATCIFLFILMLVVLLKTVKTGVLFIITFVLLNAEVLNV